MIRPLCMTQLDECPTSKCPLIILPNLENLQPEDRSFLLSFTTTHIVLWFTVIDIVIFIRVVPGFSWILGGNGNSLAIPSNQS